MSAGQDAQGLVERLEERLARFEAFARAQEQLEAEMIGSEGPWFDKIPGAVYEKMMEVQSLRNKALTGR